MPLTAQQFKNLKTKFDAEWKNRRYRYYVKGDEDFYGISMNKKAMMEGSTSMTGYVKNYPGYTPTAFDANNPSPAQKYFIYGPDQGALVINPLYERMSERNYGNLSTPTTETKIPSDFDNTFLTQVLNRLTGRAVESLSTDCQVGCTGLCLGNCSKACWGCGSSCVRDCTPCTGTCKGGCTGSCKGGCKGCSGSCSGSCSGCSGTCSGSSSGQGGGGGGGGDNPNPPSGCGNCYTVCAGGCGSGCAKECGSYCKGGCSESCTSGCAGCGSCHGVCWSCQGCASCSGTCRRHCYQSSK